MIAAKVLPGCQKDLLYQIIDFVITRRQTGTNIGIKAIGETGNKLRCCLAVLAEHGRDK